MKGVLKAVDKKDKHTQLSSYKCKCHMCLHNYEEIDISVSTDLPAISSCDHMYIHCKRSWVDNNLNWVASVAV